MTDDNRILQVLWFEDEPDTNAVYLVKVKFKIQFTFAATRDEGFRMLRENPDKWDSIILDANMPGSDGESPELSSLFESIKEITKNSGNIPYYIYSAHGESISMMFKKEVWQDKTIYDKAIPSDLDGLCRNIRRVYFERLDESALVKMKFPVITDFLLRMEELGPQTLVSEPRLIGIFGDLIKTTTENYPFQSRSDNRLNDIRKIVEEICHYLYKKGILREWHGVTGITEYSRELGKNPTIPGHIQRAFHTLTDLTNPGSHFGEFENNTFKNSISKHVSTGITPYIVSSCTLELLNILHWITTLPIKRA